MSFKILYVTAVSSEADILKKIEGMKPIAGGYQFGKFEIYPLVTGVGSITTAWSIKQWISENKKPDLAINAGIAGSYKDELAAGDVVMPVTDCFADAGIEDGDNFLTLSEAGLASANEFPFIKGFLFADNRYSVLMKNILRPVSAITVNTATGSEVTRARLIKKFNPDIETMEGAAFFYICSRESIPFLALRAISNNVETRNKSKWNIPFALDNLTGKLIEIILTIE
jgi:futalosine hydrolase